MRIDDVAGNMWFLLPSCACAASRQRTSGAAAAPPPPAPPSASEALHSSAVPASFPLANTTRPALDTHASAHTPAR
jgi:hypothetical protein